MFVPMTPPSKKRKHLDSGDSEESDLEWSASEEDENSEEEKDSPVIILSDEEDNNGDVDNTDQTDDSNISEEEAGLQEIMRCRKEKSIRRTQRRKHIKKQKPPADGNETAFEHSIDEETLRELQFVHWNVPSKDFRFDEQPFHPEMVGAQNNPTNLSPGNAFLLLWGDLLDELVTELNRILSDCKVYALKTTNQN